jgi:co-chaperonin GroES (HSP10)
MKIKGNLKPIRDNIIITDMNFEAQKTASGIVIPSDDGKSEGVKARWGRVWAVGPEQEDVQVGQWILLEHGRWSRGFTVEQDDGSELIIRRADPVAILAISNEKPNQTIFGSHKQVSHATFDPSIFANPSY